jgi:putative hemolysin
MRHAAETGEKEITLLGRLIPPPHRASGNLILLPTLRAYSGIRVAAARSMPLAEPLGRLGPLEIRLAHKAGEVRKAQKLRYRVFYEEMAAIPDPRTRFSRRDVDAFDSICDHLLVLDHESPARSARSKARVVGTYRLLRQDLAADHGGFYSAGEFAIDGLLARHRALRFLELGRSCVLAPYRTKRTVELLWHGVWSYVLAHRVDVMFGCASLEGTDPERLATVLSYLHHFHGAPDEWNAAALPQRRVDMNRIAKLDVDVKAAWRVLPPLIRGYLRLGGVVGDGAVIDHQFGTTDVLMIVPVAEINARYVHHFGPGAERHAVWPGAFNQSFRSATASTR